jgi:hypothetical protein
VPQPCHTGRSTTVNGSSPQSRCLADPRDFSNLRNLRTVATPHRQAYSHPDHQWGIVSLLPALYVSAVRIRMIQDRGA